VRQRKLQAARRLRASYEEPATPPDDDVLRPVPNKAPRRGRRRVRKRRLQAARRLRASYEERATHPDDDVTAGPAQGP
jgi:hypothetical protein